MTISHDADGALADVSPRSELLRIDQPTRDIAEALNELQGQLAVATELTEDWGDHGRAGIFRAMTALLDFCSSQGMPRATLYPLQIVAGAVVDADRGVTTPAFRADSRSGRPSIPTYEIAPRAYRAVIVECCIRQKRLEGVKAHKVGGAEAAARLLRANGWHLTLSRDQLAQLREEVTARPIGDPIRDHYDEMMDTQLTTTAPMEYARLLAAHGLVNKPPAGPTIGKTPGV